MLGQLADEIGRHAARFRIPRRVRVPAGIVKINLGSGLHVAPGWINVDGSVHALLSRAPRSVLRALYRSTSTVNSVMSEADYVERLHSSRFVFAQLEQRLPFFDDTADYIYCSHVLEHFFLTDARRFIAEIRRVLKPGGIVRICVPDLEHAFELYRGGSVSQSMAYFFTESPAGYYRQHRYMYDYTALEALLREQGLDEVVRRGYREGVVPDIELLDNRPEETLYVEARRPSVR